MTSLDENQKSLLTGNALLELCRSKHLQLWLEITPEAATDELEKGWRLFTCRPIAGLPEHTILDGHRLHYKAVTLPWRKIISAGRAAGYSQLYFGLPELNIPLVYAHPAYEKLKIAIFPFSHWATGDPGHGRLADKAAEFLIRTQIVSPVYPRLSGLWKRAFDFDLWEYYSSSADADWGAWCVESGWVNAPAAMILTLRKAGKGLFDILPETGSWSHLVPPIREEMSTVHAFSPEKVTPYTVLGDEE